MNIDFPKIWKVLADHFSLGDWSLHGPNHWRNVQRNGLSLAKLNVADEFVVRLFAVFHDAERHNEGFDPEHGRRATDLVRYLHGDLFSIEKHQLDLLCEACSFHNDGLITDDTTIGTCWDADRMDLPRVGIMPIPEKMSTEVGRDYARRGAIALQGGQLPSLADHLDQEL